MKTTAMTSVVITVLVPLAALFIAGGDACDAPLVRWTDACFKSSGQTPALYHVCQETLQHGPEEAELTAYVILAARQARWSYDDTVGRAEQLVAGGSLPGDQRASYQLCIGRYATARIQMVGVVSELTQCDFSHARQEFAAAADAMDACGKALAAGTPLAALNAADRDRTAVAYNLGALIVGK